MFGIRIFITNQPGFIAESRRVFNRKTGLIRRNFSRHLKQSFRFLFVGGFSLRPIQITAFGRFFGNVAASPKVFIIGRCELPNAALFLSIETTFIPRIFLPSVSVNSHSLFDIKPQSSVVKIKPIAKHNFAPLINLFINNLLLKSNFFRPIFRDFIF